MSREAAHLLENLRAIAGLLASEPDADRATIEGGLKQIESGLGHLRYMIERCHEHNPT